jgi:hypothetical protein
MTMLLPLLLTISAALAADAPAEVTFEPTLVEAVAPDLGAMTLPYAEEDDAAVRASQQEARALLERYQVHARTAMRGEILTTRKAGPAGAEYTIVTLQVSDTYRGRKVTRVEEFYVDRGLDDAPGRIRPELVSGYKVLVFLDRSGWLMDGDAMFTVEARHAFRKRSARVFSRPSADRDWEALTDPSASWTMLDLDSVEAAMAERPGRWDS